MLMKLTTDLAKNVLRNSKEKYLYDHELMSLCHIFYNCHGFETLLTAHDLIAVRHLQKNVSDGKEKNGLIYATRDETITFIHRSFAEYSAALWFVTELLNSNPDSVRFKIVSSFLEEHYFKEEQSNFRKFFGLILVDVEESDFGDAFRSIILGNLPKLKDVVMKNPKVICQTDKLGRTLYHAAVETGRDYTRFLMFDLVYSNWDKLPDDTWYYGKDALFQKCFPCYGKLF